MREHHRNYPYRPFRRIHQKVPLTTIIRFLHTYLMPFKWRLTLAVILVGANACSVYLIAFYTRIVVDNILAIEPVEQQIQQVVESERPWARTPVRHRRTDAPAQRGLIREMDRRPAPGRPPAAENLLFLMFLLYGASMLTLNYMERVAQNVKVKVGREMASNLREDTHRKVMELSLHYHQSTTPGRLLARITSDIEVIQDQALNLFTVSARTSSLLVVGFLILLTVDWRISLVFFVVAPFYILINGRLRQQLRYFNREMRHTNSCLYAYVTQKMEAIKAIQAYAREGLEKLHMHRLAACFLRDAVGQQRKAAAMQSTALIVTGVTTVGIFIFSISQALQGRMTVGQVLLVYGTAANLFAPIMQLPQISRIAANMQVALARLMDVLDRTPDISDAPDARPLPRPLREGIHVHNLSFSYGGHEGEESELVLRNINLDVPAGHWLCLMGGSGSGKTTLLFLLARLYRPGGGMISYDNIPLEKISMASLRNAVGFVPQVPQIFSGTVRDNITYGKPESAPEEIMQAAGMAEMHDFIMSMKVKYETIIGERGTSLSGGQRQRLALARALLTNPDILLLDDCTSALDADTERKIQQTLTQTLAGKTAVIASQRISMACRCHRIAVLDNGVVSEYGTHEELLQANGFYSRLYAQQVGEDEA